MKINQSTGHWGIALLVFFFAGTIFGCGSVKNEATGVDGSSASSVGGATVVGKDRTINVTSNRDRLSVGDNALITVTVTCTSAASLNCITDSSGALVFAAQPTEFQTGASAPLKTVVVTASYSATSTATLSETSNSFTLTAGSRAVPTASPPKAVVPGATTPKVVFTVTLTGAKTGSAIFTAQSVDSIATLLLNVF